MIRPSLLGELKLFSVSDHKLTTQKLAEMKPLILMLLSVFY